MKQHVATKHGLSGSETDDSLELSQMFSAWSVASEWFLKSESDLEGQLTVFCLTLIHSKQVEGSACKCQGHFFLACVQGRLSEVKRGQWRCLQHTEQFRTTCFLDDLWTRRLRYIEQVS